MQGLQHEWALNPVTALEFCHSRDGRLLLLVGEGAYLKVFEVGTSLLIAKCQVFEAQAIHGISAGIEPHSSTGSSLAIWGGRSFTLLDSETLEAIISCTVTSTVRCVQTASDWILDGAVSHFSKILSCIFVTAHSSAIYAQVGDLSHGAVLNTLSSPSQSILYSAHVVWTSANNIMVAAGTVFGEIEVITWNLTSTEPTGYLMFTFSGHEGSIFGVQISSEIIGPDGLPTRLLASCSDDRTIRVWDLSRRSNEHKPQLNDSESYDPARQTGFGENSDVSSRASAQRCLAVVMGHASRIWRVKFLTSARLADSPTTVNVLSFGEDATCQQWSLKSWTKASNGMTWSAETSAARPSTFLQHLETYAYHSGKHIWSASLLSYKDDVFHLATGGADGKVSIYDVFVNFPDCVSGLESIKSEKVVANTFAPENSSSTTAHGWTLQDLIEGVPPVLDSTLVEVTIVDGDDKPLPQTNRTTKLLKENLNRYCFIEKNQMLMTTSFGRVFLGSTDSSQMWQELQLPGHDNSDLKSYSVMLGLPTHYSALLTGTNGAIYMYHKNSKIVELFRIKGKVAALFDISLASSRDIQILVTALGSEEAWIFHLVSSPGMSPKLQNMVTIELSKRFIVTSAGTVDGRLVLGSRAGTLAVYCQVHDTEQFKMTPTQQITCTDAITAIVPIPSSKTKEEYIEKSHFVMTSRNGTYSVICLSMADPSEGSLSLELVHQATPPLGPMIEWAWFDGHQLLLYGFRSKNFVVWNETKQLEIANIECGGAHRTYTYLPAQGAGGAGSFAFTRASKLCLHTQKAPSHKEIKSGGHGREIKACGLSHSIEHLIATAAEDTTIRIWRERNDTSAELASGLECLAVIQKHTAGIQHLQWSPVPSPATDYLFSAGGNEEFYVWRTTFIPGFGLGIVCEASLTDYSPERDLRIMCFDVQYIEDQFFTSTLGKSKEDAFTISLAYSDSTIKQFFYSRHGGFKKMAQSRYTSSCLTQIMDHDQFLVTAATDGHLAIWDHPRYNKDESAGLNLRSHTKIHQSSILSVDYDDVLATGGDDNALALTCFSDREVTKRVIIPSAHAAAITGVGFLDKEFTPRNTRELWTVSGDQRIKKWTIDVGQDGTDIRVREMSDGDDVWCSIPDAGGLVRLHKRERDYERCLVWGNGLEIVKVEAKG